MRYSTEQLNLDMAVVDRAIEFAVQAVPHAGEAFGRILDLLAALETREAAGS